MKKIVAAVLSAAGGEVGVTEVPIGSNGGPRVMEYNRAAGYNEPVFWCLNFCYWVVLQACGLLALKNPLLRTGSCDLLLYWARREGVLHTEPQVGDIFLVLASPSDATHAGIVTGVPGGGNVKTIEGNSNNDGSRNGYAVVARTRAVKNLVFVRWHDLIPEAPRWTLVVGGENLGAAWADAQGATYAPARRFLEAAGVDTKTLAYDRDDNALVLNGQPLPVPVILRDGTTWAQVRPLCLAAGLSLKAEGSTITVGKLRPNTE